MTRVDALIIGAGPAGLAAALSLKKAGIGKVLVVEREENSGGILLQCIHNGFGVHRFEEELTGPEYAERYLELAVAGGVDILTHSSVLDIITGNEDGDDTGNGEKRVVILSEEKGLLTIEAGAIVLAMGCRERNRGNINIPGSRPSGIMTAGLAQKLVNILGYLPGKEIVILGSGDIGLIMARRLTWEGAHVKGVIEVQPFAGGLSRNIVQCLDDFKIPLYLSHTVSNIYGNKRVEAVEVSPINRHSEARKEGSFVLKCDTLLLSVGLVPENELSLKAGIVLDPVTRGPLVDGELMTTVPGIFACGNVLHVHDLVDYVSEEAETCGENAARYLKGEAITGREIRVKCGNLVRYALPAKIRSREQVQLSLRAIAPAENVTLIVESGDQLIYKKKYKRVLPSEMARLLIKEIAADASEIKVRFSPEER